MSSGSERGFRLREPRDVDLPDQVPPFRGHRSARLVAAVPVLHLIHLDIPAGDRDHEGVAHVRRGSAATWFSKIAAYGVWDIHQRTRKYVFRPDIRGRFGFIVGGFLPTGWPVDKNRRGGTIKRFLDGSRN